MSKESANGSDPAQPRKYKFMLASYCYAGNGGYAAEHPSIRKWWEPNLLALKKDPRISEVITGVYSDTPITMTRNKTVLDARRMGVDFLMMIDSDNIPDLMLKTDPTSVPFIKSSLDFMIAHHEHGPSVMFAPYCGPPPHPVNGGEENVYVFHWGMRESGDDNAMFRLEAYSRENAAIMRGIQECAAGPTGCCIFDMRAFDVTEPDEEDDEKFRGWFYYEWPDKYAAEKNSTEDVTATRDMSLAGVGMYCNWSAWAGHVKPKVVGPPLILTTEIVAGRMRRAVLSGISNKDRIVEVNPGGISTELPAGIDYGGEAVEIEGDKSCLAQT